MKELRKICFFFTSCVFANLQLTQGAVSSCNAVLEGLSGTFMSPNYPRTYEAPVKTRNSSTFPDNNGFITCQWEIIVPKGKGIQLKFGDFDMNAEADICDKGQVDIFTGTGKTKSFLDSYCPGNNPTQVVLKNNTATVVFRRPSTFSGKGFLISFIAIVPEHPLVDFVTCRDNGRVPNDASSFRVTCPTGCLGIPEQNVCGDLKKYRDDSSLCLSAVHAGVISDSFGGRVDVKKGSGSALYIGEVANNITSTTCALSDLSIYFPKAKVCRSEIRLTGRDFSASSWWEGTATYNWNWSADHALMIDDKAWSPKDPTTAQWLQVSLPKLMKITSLFTKGSSRPYKWCRSYKVQFSRDNIDWYYYSEEGSTEPKLFAGNTNHFRTARNNFVRPAIIAKYIRIIPTPVKGERNRYALKINLEGCPFHTEPPPDIPVENIPIRDPPIATTTATESTPADKETTTPPKLVATKTTTPPATISVMSTAPSTPLSTSVDNKPIQPPKGRPTPNSNRTNATTGVKNGGNPGEVPQGDLNERSIIIIAIVAALAVTSILLATLVLVLVRKRKKEPKRDSMVPKLPTSQTNATYHSGGVINSTRFFTAGKEEKHSKKSKKKGKKQKFLFKNDNYSDSYPLTPPHDQIMQNSRGGVTLMYDHKRMNNGELVTSPAPVRDSYTASDVAGPSNGLLHPGPHEDDIDSFASDDDDHEYQVIPDPVNELNDHTPRTLSKASTGSSMGAHSRASDTIPWNHAAHQGVFVPSGDVWAHERGPNPTSPAFPLTHMSSFGQPGPNRQRSGTFPHQIHNSVDGEDMPVSPGPPKTAPPAASFTAPRFPSRKHRGSQSPLRNASPNAYRGYNPPNRYSTTSSGGSHSPVEVIQRHDPSAAPYYSSVPEQVTHTSISSSPANGHLPSPKHDTTMAHKSSLSYGDHPADCGINGRRPPSYKTPRNAPFSAMSGNGVITDVRHGGSDPVMTSRANGGVDAGLRRSTSRSESFARQRSGYDQLYRNNSQNSESKPVVIAPINNYDQLNLHSVV